MVRICILLSLVAMLGCSSAPVKSNSGIESMGKSRYASLVKKNSARTSQYSGFHQTFQATLTIMTAELQAEMLRQRAVYLQWDQTTYQAERDKMMQEAAAYSKFFMRFFSPEYDYDDLDKEKTVWKVYLDYNGTRFEGKARRLTEKFVELQNSYPYLDRFSSAYEITFNVPMTTVEGGVSKVTLTSSLGSAEFKFPTGK